MIYRDFDGIKLSALGMGTMRFPVIGGDDSVIDVAQVKEMVDYCMANGVNYYDTAWVYHMGNAEVVLGDLLNAYPRDSFYIADKFPGFADEYFDDLNALFEKQLEKCKVEYFDFYLLHNINAATIDRFMKPEVKEFFAKQKENGRIKHLGFSTHADYNDFCRFLDMYGDIVEFCQIQLNWFDWNFQDAKAKVDKLNEIGLPIWVMEPQRGGCLINYVKENHDSLSALRPEETDPGWSFRFLQSIPTVKVVLSGMSNLEQVKQNIEIFSTDAPLNEDEKQALFDIAADMTNSKTVPCTACRYCTGYCPMGLNIPHFVAIYNDTMVAGISGDGVHIRDAYTDDKLPSACLGCGACVAACPQNIQIPDIMTFFTEKYL